MQHTDKKHAANAGPCVQLVLRSKSAPLPIFGNNTADGFAFPGLRGAESGKVAAPTKAIACKADAPDLNRWAGANSVRLAHGCEQTSSNPSPFKSDGVFLSDVNDTVRQREIKSSAKELRDNFVHAVFKRLAIDGHAASLRAEMAVSRKAAISAQRENWSPEASASHRTPRCIRTSPAMRP